MKGGLSVLLQLYANGLKLHAQHIIVASFIELFSWMTPAFKRSYNIREKKIDKCQNVCVCVCVSKYAILKPDNSNNEKKIPNPDSPVSSSPNFEYYHMGFISYLRSLLLLQLFSHGPWEWVKGTQSWNTKFYSSKAHAENYVYFFRGTAFSLFFVFPT